MKVQLCEGVTLEEKEPGFIDIEVTKLPAQARLSREEFARRVAAACNEVLDNGG